MPVMETLYKTNAPEELERAEYYQPRIEQKVLCGKWVFFVTEKHAWYDDRGKQVLAPGFTLDPKEEEGYPSLEAAKARYDQQVKHRASEGFVHSFYIEFDDIALIPRHKYRRIEGG